MTLRGRRFERATYCPSAKFKFHPLAGCGTAIAFHPSNPKVFLVGTEEGQVFKCSTEYTSMYLLSYGAHHMPVHRIHFNYYLPDIFITCSADWRIKIWEDGRT